MPSTYVTKLDNSNKEIPQIALHVTADSKIITTDDLSFWHTGQSIDNIRPSSLYLWSIQIKHQGIHDQLYHVN